MLITFSVMATWCTSKYSITGALSWLFCPLLRIRADLSLYLRRHEDSSPPEQIAGHLPVERIHDVLNNSGKTGTESITVQMA